MGARRHRNLPSVLVVAAVALLLAACGGGGLDTPDLTRGDVTGQIEGASPGGFVYVVGQPEIFVEVAPDGSFTLPDVPAGTAKIMVYDGSEHAELVGVEVKGAGRSHWRKRAQEMAKAGSIRVDARCRDQASSVGAEFEVTTALGEATRIRSSKKGEDDDVVLYPVPKGDWKVRTRLQGYKDDERDVHVEEDEDKDLPEIELENEDD